MRSPTETTGSPSIRTRIARFPFWPLVVVAIVSLSVQEFFPLSRFPMYSKPDDETWYVYVADDQGAPIALLRHFGVSNTFVRKVFKSARERLLDRDGTLDRETAEARAGVETLDYLVRQRRTKKKRPREFAGLQLIKVDVELAGDHVERAARAIAESVIAASAPASRPVGGEDGR